MKKVLKSIFSIEYKGMKKITTIFGIKITTKPLILKTYGKLNELIDYLKNGRDIDILLSKLNIYKLLYRNHNLLKLKIYEIYSKRKNCLKNDFYYSNYSDFNDRLRILFDLR